MIYGSAPTPTPTPEREAIATALLERVYVLMGRECLPSDASGFRRGYESASSEFRGFPGDWTCGVAAFARSFLGVGEKDLDSLLIIAQSRSRTE